MTSADGLFADHAAGAAAPAADDLGGPRPPAHHPYPRPPSPLRPAEEALPSEMAESRRSHFLAFAASGEADDDLAPERAEA